MHDDFAPRALASPASYERRRTEVFWLTFVGYVACYFVRNNTAVASGLLVLEEGWTPLDVGVVLTGFTVTYGLAKLVMGVVVDRSSLRVGYGLALIASAVVCLAMGFIPDVFAMTAAMAVIGLAQGVCAPASLATLGAWYPPWQRSARVAVWNTSQNVGAALLPLLASGAMLIAGVQHWSLAYWVPGVFALAAGVWVLRRGGDRPWREGYATLPERYGADALPEVRGSTDAPYWRLVRLHVLGNRPLWALAGLNALLYLLRFGVLNWIPLYTIGELGFSVPHAAWVMATYELAAVPGALAFALVAHRWPNRMATAGAAGLVVLAVGLMACSNSGNESPLNFSSIASASTMHSIASATQVAAATAQTSLRSLLANTVCCDWISTECKGWVSVGIGFITARSTIGSPFVIPPSMPPARLVWR